MIFNKSISAKKGLLLAATAITTLVIGFGITSIVSHAESSGKITADAVNVRSEASAGSEAIGKKEQNETITIIGQVAASDGYTWYQISMGDGKVGYVRSDLAAVTDGSIPDTIGADGTITSGDASINKVNPVAGAVAGGQAVRVRQDASTSSTIVTSAESGTALTVNGTKEGTDSRTWYFVSFEQDGNTVSGFIRSDFIEVSGDLTPFSEEAPAEEPGAQAEPDASPEPEVKKDYDTQLQGDEWYLLDYAGGQQYSIKSIFENLDSYKTKYDKQKKSVGALRGWMIAFMIIAIVAIAGCVFLYMKLRDLGDQALFAAAEKNVKAKLGGFGAKKPEQKPAQPRPQGAPGARPQGAPGARPQGAPGARPQGAPGARPQGAPGPRPQGAPAQRPVGPNGRPQGQRVVSVNGQRTVLQEGQKISQAPDRPVRPVQTDKPVQNDRQAAPERPISNDRVARPDNVDGAQQPRPVQPQKPSTAPKQVGGKPEDDEFEFGFLNWDGDNK